MGGVRANSDAFRAVADPTRRTVLDRLREGECDVSDLAQPLAVGPATLSEHLRILLEAGLVRVRREGRRRIYSINTVPLQGVVEWVERFRDFTDPEGHAWRLEDAAPGSASSLARTARKKGQNHGRPRRAQ